MKSKIDKIAALFSRMVANANSFGDIWKNIAAGREAFGLMREMPDTVAGEFEAPAAKAALLCQMLDQMCEDYSPRLCIEVREYIRRLDPDNADNMAALARLHDYVDLSLPMEDYCRKYKRHLKFDPVERTEEMEAVVEDVERECDDELKDVPRGMGFCFAYWHARKEALARRGIEWRSPGAMNPGVMFD